MAVEPVKQPVVVAANEGPSSIVPSDRTPWAGLEWQELTQQGLFKLFH
jgi:hypothetical protein